MKHQRWFKAFLLTSLPLATILTLEACKARRRPSSVSSSTIANLSLEEVETFLRQISLQEAEYLAEIERQDLATANQWNTNPQIYARLSPQLKQRLGDPSQASETVLALDQAASTSSAPVHVTADLKYAELQKKKKYYTDLLAQLKSNNAIDQRMTLEPLATNKSFCNISDKDPTNACYCFQKFNFSNLPDGLKDPCAGEGKFGNFCGGGFVFQTPSLLNHLSLLSFPTASNSDKAITPNTPKPLFLRSDLMRFLEWSFTWRGCGLLNSQAPNGDAQLIKNIAGGTYASWVNGPMGKLTEVPPRTATPEQLGGCYDVRRDANADNPNIEGKAFWRTGQCVPLSSYNNPVRKLDGTSEVKKLKRDPIDFFPKSEVNRFVWSERTNPGARIYCSKDWVLYSGSQDADIKVGSLINFGSTYAIADTSLLPGQKGSPSTLEAAVKAATLSVERRWQAECANAANYVNKMPSLENSAKIFDFRCLETPPQVAGVDQSIASVENAGVRKKFFDQQVSCSFFDSKYEQVHQCELDRGRLNGTTCCSEILTQPPNFFEPANVQKFCADFENRDITYPGLLELKQKQTCVAKKMEWLTAANQKNLALVASARKDALSCQRDYCSQIDGLLRSKLDRETNKYDPELFDEAKKCTEEILRTFGSIDPESPADSTPRELNLKNEIQATQAETIDLWKKIAPLRRDRYRGYALSPARDCKRVKTIVGINEAFVPCHEKVLTQDGTTRQQKDGFGCYADGSVPDSCNGYPTTQCSEADPKQASDIDLPAESMPVDPHSCETVKPLEAVKPLQKAALDKDACITLATTISKSSTTTNTQASNPLTIKPPAHQLVWKCQSADGKWKQTSCSCQGQ